jgi:predicted dehydrogenase/nucleoside-diphosphate-sugar epimerase
MRLIILGAGAVVREFYLPALERLNWTRDILVIDVCDGALSSLRKDYPWLMVQRGSTEILSSDLNLRTAYDAVIIALPNSLHVDAVATALEAGYSVLCEKPLALRNEDCIMLGRVASDRKLVLAVGMVRRHSAAAQALRHALQQRFLGRLLEIDVDHGGPYAWTSVSGAFFRKENGGILTDLGVHHLDWIFSITGPLEFVSYEDDAAGGVEASCDYRLKSASGIPVRIRLSHRFKRPDVTRFRCERGSLMLRKSKFDTCEWQSADGLLSGGLCHKGAFSDPSWPHDFVSCFAEQFLHFDKAVRGDASSVITAFEAAATMRLIDTAYRNRRIKACSPGKDDRPSLPHGRCLVTGGTGFIGSVLLERLAFLGMDELVVPVRGYQTCASAARFPVSLPKVDLTDREAIRACVNGVRWIFHLALGASDEDAFRITVEGTRILVEEAEAAGVEAVVILSTAWVYGLHKSPRIVTEQSPLDPVEGEYASSKAAMQKACLQLACQMKRTRLIILNPTCVYGPEGKTFTRMPVDLEFSGHFAWVEGGRGTANYIYVDNLVDAMLLTAVHPDAHGKAWLASDGHCSWRKFLSSFLSKDADKYPDYPSEYYKRLENQSNLSVRQLFNHLYGFPPLRRWLRERSIVRVIRKLFSLQLSLPARSEASISAMNSPVWWLPNLFGPTATIFDASELRDLGWASKVDFDEGMKRTREWLAQNQCGDG